MRPSPEPFYPKLSIPAEGSVVLLGAGASATAGAPLMRGFIDRARDYIRLGLFESDVLPHIQSTIDFYDLLRARLRITEEDIENVENLLSLAELTDQIPNPLRGENGTGLADSIRRFIEAVLVKAIRLPAPDAPEWLGLATPPFHKRLITALAHGGEKIAVITLNYDCVLEYTCHCLGVPYTYRRDMGAGVEILKLHGSINWLSCPRPSCAASNEIHIAELHFRPGPGPIGEGTIDPVLANCPRCSTPMRPHIVPPTWSKTLDDRELQRTWARALSVLVNAETIVAAGYSLPAADPKVRQLLHVGLSSAKLRQALIAVGNDEDAAQRWSRLFRESWRDYRLSVRKQTFDDIAQSFLFQALSINDPHLDQSHLQVLPLANSPAMSSVTRERLQTKMREHGVWREAFGICGVDWCKVLRDSRSGKPIADSSTTAYREILRELDLDWKPSAPILPTHGRIFPTP